MRNRATAKENEYILISGFSGSEIGIVAPAVKLMRGNGYHEETVAVLKPFPVNTAYQVVVAEGKPLAKERQVTFGRNFSSDDWLGKMS